MNEAIIKRGYRNGVPGAFSTIELPGGVIETVFFPDDMYTPSVVIGRTVKRSLESIQLDHIELDRNV